MEQITDTASDSPVIAKNALEAAKTLGVHETPWIVQAFEVFYKWDATKLAPECVQLWGKSDPSLASVMKARKEGVMRLRFALCTALAAVYLVAPAEWGPEFIATLSDATRDHFKRAYEDQIMRIEARKQLATQAKMKTIHAANQAKKVEHNRAKAKAAKKARKKNR